SMPGTAQMKKAGGSRKSLELARSWDRAHNRGWGLEGVLVGPQSRCVDRLGAETALNRWQRKTGREGALSARSGCCRGRHLDDQVVLLDRNRKRLCDVRPLDEARASFDRHLELPRPYRFGLAPPLTRADARFPAVPGAAQEFLLAPQTVTTQSVPQDHPVHP